MAETAHLAPQYDDPVQQKTTALFGMWVFIATEVLFFGGLFLSYTLYRAVYPAQVAHAARELNVTIGTINTAVLLTSSYFMANAVRACEDGKRKLSGRYLALTVALGLLFLILKGYEYYDDAVKHLNPGHAFFYHGPDEGVMRLFYWIYYLMTGLHALHVTIGVCVIGVIWRKTRRGEYSPEYSTPVEVAALYWHFVDVVWIFLYPLLYLVGRSG